MKYKFLIAFMLSFQMGYTSSEVNAPASTYGPEHLWLTGPLLTPTAQVTPPGHVNLEPYLYMFVNNGRYQDDWNAKAFPKLFQLNPQILFKVGLVEKFDILGVYQMYYSWRQQESSFQFGDLPLSLEYQFYEGESATLIKFYVKETFPIGNYQNLNHKKKGTDSSGQGSFVTSSGVTFSRVYDFGNQQYFRPRVDLSLNFPAPVKVSGLNTYGESKNTHGTVIPGNGFTFYVGMEYTLTKEWALALDLAGFMAGKTRFKGWTDTKVGYGSSAQFTAAPAIEYNWREDMGLIAGAYLSVAGRNSTRFYSIGVAYNYYF